MLTPRPYLSWSQMTLVEKAPETYVRRYIKNDTFAIPVNRGMALGKEIATSLEIDEETGDPTKDLIIAQLPKFEIMEAKLEATVKIGDIEVPLYGKADTAKKDLSAFKEYKTGKIPWTQKKVDDHGQITFYCTIIHALTGKIPKDIELVNALTHELPDGKFELTGEIRRIRTERTLKDILKMKIRIKNAWSDIVRLCEEEFI